MIPQTKNEMTKWALSNSGLMAEYKTISECFWCGNPDDWKAYGLTTNDSAFWKSALETVKKNPHCFTIENRMIYYYGFEFSDFDFAEYSRPDDLYTSYKEFLYELTNQNPDKFEYTLDYIDSVFNSLGEHDA